MPVVNRPLHLLERPRGIFHTRILDYLADQCAMAHSTKHPPDRLSSFGYYPSPGTFDPLGSGGSQSRGEVGGSNIIALVRLLFPIRCGSEPDASALAGGRPKPLDISGISCSSPGRMP